MRFRRYAMLALAGCVVAFVTTSELGAQSSRAAASRAGSPPDPDLVLLHGKIFTGVSAHPWAEALAIRGDRIIAVGSDPEITARATGRTRRIDVAGRLVIPGINDAHIHLGKYVGAAVLDVGTNPGKDPTFAETRDSLRAVAARTPAGRWIIGDVGAVVLADSAARRRALDAVTTRHPVMLNGFTGHSSIANSAALRALGISKATRDPLGGRIDRDASGEPTGLLEEYAGWNAFQRLVESQSDAILVRELRDNGRAMLRFGITSIQDMAHAYGAARTMAVLRGAELPLRVRVVGMANTAPTSRLLVDWDRVRSADTLRFASGGTVVTSGIKWILDGTPIERLALMRAPYADAPGWYGRADFPPDTVRAMLLEARARHQQIMLHVSGDSSPAVVLTEMERTGGAPAWRDARLRFEHGDGLARDLRRRALPLGVIVVQNPAHFTFPAVARRRLTPARMLGYQPLKSLLADGIHVAFGSDGLLNPYLNIMFATTHPNDPDEAITVEQALSAYTSGSAYAEFADASKGKLAPGMLADLAVLSQDIFTIPSPALPATVSVLTVVGGKPVYDARDGQLPAEDRSVRHRRPSHAVRPRRTVERQPWPR